MSIGIIPLVIIYILLLIFGILLSIKKKPLGYVLLAVAVIIFIIFVYGAIALGSMT